MLLCKSKISCKPVSCGSLHIQAKLEFELTMQRPNLKDEFDEELVLWTKAVVKYCKRACTRSTAIQKLVKDVDVDCEFTIVHFSYHRSKGFNSVPNLLCSYV